MTAVAAEQRRADPLEAEIISALDTVLDPELDQPVTELGFVRSVTLDDAGVEVHLRLPTAFCAPNFAYLMVSDAHDALSALVGVGRVRVLLDDHHDSELINAGVAAGLDYRGTFGHEAEDSLDELRLTFQRKAHRAAMERCCRLMLARRTWTVEELGLLELLDLPEGREKAALMRRREAIGLPNHPHAPVFVDHRGDRVHDDEIPMQLRRAAATRISIEGNAHFCRGLLATRYTDIERDTGAPGPGPVVTNTRSRS
jgi:metal-sulfur cluster biosynthetic enzyme